jgi:hypothetical protein
MIRSAIAFGIRAIGCLYVSYWAIFFGSVAFLIISSYLKERGHQPPARPVPHEMQQHHHK